MRDKGIPWFMRLTIQNSRTGQRAFAMYPCEKYEMLESLDRCQHIDCCQKTWYMMEYLCRTGLCF